KQRKPNKSHANSWRGRFRGKRTPSLQKQQELLPIVIPGGGRQLPRLGSHTQRPRVWEGGVLARERGGDKRRWRPVSVGERLARRDIRSTRCGHSSRGCPATDGRVWHSRQQETKSFRPVASTLALA